MRGETLKLGFKGLFFNFSFSFEDKIIPVRENRDFFVIFRESLEAVNVHCYNRNSILMTSIQ